MNERTSAPAEASEAAGSETMKSLRSGLRVLLEFERGPRDISMTELAKRCELSKSQVSKILSALVDSGLVAQDPATRSYAIDKRAYILGSRYPTYDPLCQAAIPVMRQLLNRTGHSVRLSVLHGEQSLYLIGLEGPLFLDTGWSSGSTVPIGASSAGRVLMAFLPQEERERLLDGPVPELTPYTVRDRAAVAALVEQAQRTGYSVQRNETTLGLGVATVPLFKAGQQVVGALGLSFPSHHVTADEEAELVGELQGAARVISQRLGCSVYPFGAFRAPIPGDARPAAPRPESITTGERTTYT